MTHFLRTVLYFFLLLGTINFLSAQEQAFFKNKVNGVINTIAVNGDTVYVGGTFTRAGKIGSNGIIVDPETGVDFGIKSPNAIITSSTADGNGGYFIAGNFTLIGDEPRSRIAQFDSTGSLTDFAMNLPISSGSIFEIIRKDSILYICGDKLQVNGSANSSNLLSINLNTNFVTDISKSLSSSGFIFNMAIDNGIIYLGGNFSSIGSIPRSNLAAIDIATNEVTSWNPKANGSVYVLASYAGIVYASGNFTSIGTSSAPYFAAIDIVSGLLKQGSPILDKKANTIEFFDNHLYLGGDFRKVNGVSRNYIAIIELKYNILLTFNPTFNAPVRAIKKLGDSLLIGGNFTSVYGRSRPYVAKVHSKNSGLSSFNLGASSPVSTISTSESHAFFGGGGHGFGGSIRMNVAAFNKRTGELLDWNVRVTGGQTGITSVKCLVYDKGQVFIGGDFYYVHGVSRNYCASVSAFDGTVTDFNPDLRGVVNSVAPYEDKVFVGGYFLNVNGIAAPRRENIASFDRTTGLVTDWNPGTGTFSGTQVNFMKIFNDTLYIGGAFTKIGSVERHSLAALNLKTSQFLDWNPLHGGVVESLDFTDEYLYIAGVGLTFHQSIFRGSLAAVNRTTGTLSAWNPTSNNGSRIYAIQVADGMAFVGGDFTAVAGAPRKKLAALDLSTGQAINWDPGPDGIVRSLAYTDGLLFVGGEQNFINIEILSKEYVGELFGIKFKEEPGLVFNLSYKTYGDAPFQLVASSNSDSPIVFTTSSPNVVNIEGLLATIENAGAVMITAHQASNQVFSSAKVSRKISISKKELDVIPDDQSRQYGSPNPPLTVNFSGFVNGEDENEIDFPPHIFTRALESSKPGNYPIEVSGGNDGNYTFKPVDGILTVTPAILTVIADSKAKVYGEPSPDLTITYSGFVNGENWNALDVAPEASLNADSTSSAGDYSIVVSGGQDDNYSYYYVNGTLTVSKASLTAHAQDEVRRFGEPNPALTIAYSGFVNSEGIEDLIEEPVAYTSARRKSPPGEYPISLSGGSSANYLIHLAHGVITVTCEECYNGKLNPPTDFGFTFVGTDVILTWTDNSEIESGYQLQRRRPGKSWTTTANLEGNTKTYTDSDLAEATSYEYRIRALRNASADHSYWVSVSMSTPEVTVSKPPTSLTVERIESNVILSWVDQSSVESGFEIFMKQADFSWKQVGVVNENTTQYVMTGIPESTTLAFRVRSFRTDTGMKSLWSNKVTIVIPELTIVSRPTGLHFVSNGTSVTLTWRDNSSVESGYEVLRKKAGKNWNSIVTLPANSTLFTNQSLNMDVSYIYKVRALGTEKHKASLWSNQVNVNISSVSRQGTIESGNSTSSVVRVFPNPTSGKFIVKADDDLIAVIYDLTGAEILRFRTNQENDLTGLPTGVYLINLISAEGDLLESVKLSLVE